MAVVKKISELVPKGSALGVTDLLVVGVDNGTDYDLKSVTGAQLLGTVVSQTITDGDTTHSPSSNVVFDALALKVDKVAGKGLSTEDYTSAEKTKLSGLTGTNTGDQTLQTVTNLGNSTTQQLISTAGVFFTTGANQTLSGLYSTDSNTKGALLLADLIGNSTYYKLNEITVNSNSILLPSSAGTLALISDLTSKVDSNTAITGATKTKITYDSKGLVTSGADATTSDIADSLNKRYVTDANLTTIGNQSGTNTGDETVTTIKTKLGISTLSGSNTGDQDLSGLMVKSNNLSDLTNTTTARTNLGLGTLATQSGTFSGTSSGTNTGDQIISDATISLTDITTNNFDTTKHGFVPKGTNVGNFLKDDGTWGTPASGSSGGIWGIANSSGVYTYYATWALAVAAATSGKCIELFADITENSVSYTLKNGVNINGNGHTITGTTTATFNDASVTVICDVSNLIISKSLGGALSMTSTSSIITGNCKIISTDGSYDGCIVYGQLTGWSINGSLTYPIALYSTGILNYININTTSSTGITSYSTTCKINNCTIKTAGTGISSSGSSGGIVNNCTVNTNGVAISIVTGEVNNCSANSNTATAIGLGANSSANNCYGRSAAGVACGGVASSTFNNCEFVTDANVTGTSTPNYYNCKLWSKADWVLNGGGGGKIVNCTIISNYNGPVIREVTTGTYIVDCYFEVTNTGATPIFSSGTPTLYMKGNSVKGTTNFKSAGIIQGQTNTADAQGNIILN